MSSSEQKPQRKKDLFGFLKLLKGQVENSTQFRGFFETLLLFLSLYNLITITYRIGFEDKSHVVLIVFDVLTDCIFFFDILYRLFVVEAICACFKKENLYQLNLLSSLGVNLQNFRRIFGVKKNGRHSDLGDETKSLAGTQFTSIYGSGKTKSVLKMFEKLVSDEKKHLTQDQNILKKLFRVMVKQCMLIEIISLIPLEFVLFNTKYAKYGRLLRFLSLFRIVVYRKSFEVFITKKLIPPFLFRIINSFVILLLVIHVYACVWWWLARFNSRHNNFLVDNPMKRPLFYSILSSTLESNDYSFMLRLKQYLVSWYYAATYMNGFNAPIPQDLPQSIYSCLYLITGAFFFVLIVGSIGSLLHNVNKTEQEFDDRMNTLERYLNFKKLNTKLKCDVKNYFRIVKRSGNFLTFISGEEGEENDDIFYDLDVNVKKQVCKKDKGDFVKKVKMFQQLNDDFFIEDVCLRLQYMLILKGYTIIQQGTIGREMFFLISGEVDVIIDVISSNNGDDKKSLLSEEVLNEEEEEEEDENKKKEKKVVATLCSGSYFGEIALLMDSTRTASIASKTVCEVYVLQQKHFQKILNQYPEYRSIFEIEAKKRIEMLKKK